MVLCRILCLISNARGVFVCAAAQKLVVSIFLSPAMGKVSFIGNNLWLSKVVSSPPTREYDIMLLRPPLGGTVVVVMIGGREGAGRSTAEVARTEEGEEQQGQSFCDMLQLCVWH